MEISWENHGKINCKWRFHGYFMGSNGKSMENQWISWFLTDSFNGKSTLNGDVMDRVHGSSNNLPSAYLTETLYTGKIPHKP